MTLPLRELVRMGGNSESRTPRCVADSSSLSEEGDTRVSRVFPTGVNDIIDPDCFVNEITRCRPSHDLRIEANGIIQEY